MAKPHVVVIGADSTSAATVHDTAWRDLRVTLVERIGLAGVKPATAIMNLQNELLISAIKKRK